MKKSPKTWPTARGSPRAWLLVTLLSLSLALTLVLAWQAQLSAQHHLRAAENVLREYALMVSDEFIRRSFTQIGYRGYFQLASLLRSPAIEVDGLAAIHDSQAEPAQYARRMARGYFAFDPATLQFETLDLPVSAPVLAQLKTLAPAAFDGEPFRISHFGAGQNARMLVYADAQTTAGIVWRGFEVDLEVLGEQLRTAFDQGPLLPPSLANGALTNDLIDLRVRDPSGRTVFRTGGAGDPYLRVRKVIGDDYQRILENFTVVAAIHAQAADALVIGGLPRSRLPLLLLTGVLVIGLLVSAIWLLRREQIVTRMRNDFVSQVSHELRTPLTQIRMFAETLILDRVRNEQERARALTIINREAQRLSQLVDNILRFSGRGNSTRITTAQQSLAPLVRAVTEEFRSIAPDVPITLKLEAVAAPVDQDALRQILLNLLDNAVKYGGEDGPVHVALDLAGEHAELSVTDTGPGIPASKRQHVFNEFYRLRREARGGATGTGIGLAVVKDLVAAHGGECEIRDHTPNGTRMVVRLPGAR